MKKLIKLLSILFLFGLILGACEGPEGPAGLDGEDGEDGLNGIDGTATCFVCHDGTTIETVQGEFYSSQHALGDIAVDYAGGRSYCAQCHSHQGFVEYHTTGSIAADYSAPEAWECATCHTLHTAFDSTDWGFRASDAVTFLADGTTSFDNGNNNLCANCHQSRRNDDYYDVYTSDTTFTRTFTGDDISAYTAAAVGPTGSATLNGTSDTLTVVFDVPSDYVYISSTHAGPHHGPQANVFLGVGAAGSVTGTTYSAHSGGCVMCHMGSASGHSFLPEDGNCTDCHTSGPPTSAMDEIADRIAAIADELESLHAIHYDEEEGVYHPMYASITRDQFQAFWNFMIALEDRSDGAHNPTFVKALLTDAETKLGL